MQSEQKVTAAIETYADMIKRICFYHLKNPADTEDVFQNVFLKYMMHDEPFFDDEHEKAWLIVTASNACKDALKHWWRKNADIADCEALAQDAPFEMDGILSAVLELPADYKTAVFLYYYEGYSTPEIARMLDCPQSTVRSRLARARKLLEKEVCPQ